MKEGAEEQEIDLIGIVRKIWDGRILIIKWCGIAIIIGLIVAFSIPKEFSTNVTLAPESKGKSTGNMGTLVAIAGINLGTSAGEDALSPELYPNIITSTPFLVELFDVPVQSNDGKINTTLYTYLKDYQRLPWWSAILSAPFKIPGWVVSLFRDTRQEGAGRELDLFRLTKDESTIANDLSRRIYISVDKKTGVIALSVMMQDPLISATITDTVMVRLQNYITDYRTNKARHDLLFTVKLFEEAKMEYHAAQQVYANYVDGNRKVAMQSHITEQERLQNEMSLAFGLYNQVSQQLQIAKAKVQEITPVYTVVQPATVSLSAAKPRKPVILIGFVFLAGIAGVGWILFLRDLRDRS